MKFKSLFLAGAAMAATSAIAQSAYAANAKVCFEAEKASVVQSPLKKVASGANKNYSGSGFIDIPWDENKTKGLGSATIKFNVKKAGVYYIWARTFWANGCGNSIAVSVNGSGDKILGEDGTYDKWHWVGGVARVQLKAGVNTIVLKNRETGVRVDQFFFCEDGKYTPVGIRKVNA
jgi:hypothetical protein